MSGQQFDTKNVTIRECFCPGGKKEQKFMIRKIRLKTAAAKMRFALRERERAKFRLICKSCLVRCDKNFVI